MITVIPEKKGPSVREGPLELTRLRYGSDYASSDTVRRARRAYSTISAVPVLPGLS